MAKRGDYVMGRYRRDSFGVKRVVRTRRVKRKRDEGIFDFLKGAGIEDICLAKVLLDNIQLASQEAEAAAARAERTQRQADIEDAHDQIQDFCDSAQDALDELKDLPKFKPINTDVLRNMRYDSRSRKVRSSKRRRDD